MNVKVPVNPITLNKIATPNHRNGLALFLLRRFDMRTISVIPSFLWIEGDDGLCFMVDK